MEECPEKFPAYFETTAWFLDKTGEWISYITNRTPSMALSLKDPNKYNEAITSLKKYCDIIDSTQVAKKQQGGRYPVQRGVLCTTYSTIDVSHDLLTYHGYIRVFSSHLGTECQESDFSRVRSKNNAPDAKEFKNALRVISVVRSLKPSAHSNCGASDETSFLTSIAWAKALRYGKIQEEEFEDWVHVPREAIFQEMAEMEDPKHVYLMGFIVLKTVGSQSYCELCKVIFSSSQPTDFFHRFVEKRDFTGKALCYITKEGYEMFSACETIFDANRDIMFKKKWLIKRFTKAAVKHVKQSLPNLPVCHLNIMINRYFKFRLNKFCIAEKRRVIKPLQQELIGVAKSSLSMAGHSQLKM